MVRTPAAAAQPATLAPAAMLPRKPIDLDHLPAFGSASASWRTWPGSSGSDRRTSHRPGSDRAFWWLAMIADADRDAMTRANVAARGESRTRAKQIDAKLRKEPWEAVGRHAAFLRKSTRSV